MMLAKTSKLFAAVGLSAFLAFSIGCKEDKPCAKDISETVTLKPVKGSNHLLMSVDKLDFLADPTVLWEDIELEVTLKGKRTSQESISLSFNGFKFNRKDGQRPLESVGFLSKKNTSSTKFKLHKMYLNGAEPFHVFLTRIKKNKGVLTVHIHGKKLEVVEAKITFKGKSYIKCPTPTPTPTPTPVPVAPETTLDSKDPSRSPTSSTSITFAFSSSTEGNSFYCSLDGATAELCTSPQSYSGLAAGFHTFKVYAQSPQGLQDLTPESYTWKVDNIAPAVSITNAGVLPTLTNVREIQFEFSSTKEGSTFKCSLDGATAVACSSPVRYAALSEGAHVVSVNATDSLGNVGKVPASFRWTVDATAPLASFIDISPADPVSSADFRSFTFNADEAATFECAVDGAGFVACASPLVLNNSSEGPHSFSLRATDAAGNQGLPVSYAWTIDKTAPVLQLGAVSPSPGLTNAQNISVEFAVSEDATLKCSLDGVFGDCSSPYTARDLSEGDHSLEITATDAAGNHAVPVQISWTVDVTAPVLSFGEILPSAATYLSDNNVTLNINASAGSTLYASLNGGVTAMIGNPLVLSNLAEASYSVAIYGVDAAGNASGTITHSFNIDRTSPGLTVTVDNRVSPTNSDQNSFSFASTEEGLFECNIDNLGFEVCESPKSIAGLADGTHLVQIRAKDLAGNLSAISEYQWVVDTRPPKTSVSGSSNGDMATMALSADEAGVTYICTLDGEPLSPCSEVINYTGLSAGPHDFLAKAIDRAGNVDPVGASYQFVVIKPIRTIIESATPGDSPTNNRTMTIRFRADQPNATFMCSLDGAAAKTCVSPISYNNLTDGTHKFVVKAVDSYGNMDPTGASHSWIVDATAPVVTGPTFQVTANSITVTWTTNEPANRQVFYGVGANINQATAESSDYTTTHSVKLTGLSPNTTYSIQLSGQDMVGNSFLTPVRTAKTSR